MDLPGLGIRPRSLELQADSLPKEPQYLQIDFPQSVFSEVVPHNLGAGVVTLFGMCVGDAVAPSGQSQTHLHTLVPRNSRAARKLFNLG